MAYLHQYRRHRKSTAHLELLVNRPPMKGLDTALAQQIRQLRESLRLSQGDFAERLGVARTQIVAWEKGDKERPSFEKILEMAELAPDRDLRMWFRSKAGVNLDALRSDFENERAASGEMHFSEDVIDIPVFGEFLVEPDGSIDRTLKGSIPIPYERVKQPDAVLCLSAVYRPPWVISSEEIILINTGVSDFPNLRERMAAVFFPSFPRSSLTSLAQFPTRFRYAPPEPYLDPDKSLAVHAYLRQKDPKIEPEIALENEVRPGILTGWLHIDYDSGATASNGEEQISRWRLVLQL
jgi:transcriptional regulator with XRE-family HTH domain